MKTLDVMTKEDLKKSSADGGYSLTEWYIRKHKYDMGCHHGLFDREQVELHLREQLWKERYEREARDEKLRDIRGFIDRKVRELQTTAKARFEASGEILGKGGKQRKESAA